MGNVRRRAQSIIHRKPPGTAGSDYHDSMHPSDLAETSYKGPGTATDEPMEMSHVYGLPPGLQRHGLDGHNSGHYTPPGQSFHPIAWADDVGHERAKSRGSLAPEPPSHTAKRQFSFHNVFHRHKHDDSLDSGHARRPSSRTGLGSRQSSSRDQNIPGHGKSKTATEEERLGLVKGDSSAMSPVRDDTSDEDDWQLAGRTTMTRPRGTSAAPVPIREEDKESDEGERWAYHDSSSPTSPEFRTVLPVPKLKGTDELDFGSESERDIRNVKDWEGRGGGGAGRSGGPGGGAFI